MIQLTTIISDSDVFPLTNIDADVPQLSKDGERQENRWNKNLKKPSLKEYGLKWFLILIFPPVKHIYC